MSRLQPDTPFNLTQRKYCWTVFNSNSLGFICFHSGLLTEIGIGFRGEWYKCWKWGISEKAEMPYSSKSSYEVSTSKIGEEQGRDGTSSWKADTSSRFRLWLWRKGCHVFRKKSFKHKGKQSNGKYSVSPTAYLSPPHPWFRGSLWWFKLTLMGIMWSH